VQPFYLATSWETFFMFLIYATGQVIKHFLDEEKIDAAIAS